MSDEAEFEKLTMLEARLAAALDRIAVGLGEMQAPLVPQMDDPGVTSAAMEDALARAEAAETRAAAFEADLADARAALDAAPATGVASHAEDADGARLTEERDQFAAQVEALEAAREADRDEARRALEARDAEIASLLELVSGAPQDKPEDEDALADLREELDLARERVRRLRTQRGEARKERDEARDLLEELRENGAESPDQRVIDLRAELSRLRAANDDLLEQIDALRGGEGPTATMIDEALVEEITALREARASEAAEVQRILADLEPVLSQGGAHA